MLGFALAVGVGLIGWWLLKAVVWLIAGLTIGIIFLLMWMWRGWKTSARNVTEAFGAGPPSSRVEKGRLLAKESSFFLGGLLRDNSPAVDRLRRLLHFLTPLVGSLRVAIVENDSSDDTRSRLLELVKEDPRVTVLGCGRNVSSCSLSLPATQPGHFDFSPTRIGKMAKLRNLLLDEVRNGYSPDFGGRSTPDFGGRSTPDFGGRSTPDFVWFFDADLDATLYTDGFLSAIGAMAEDPDLSAVCANAFTLSEFPISRMNFYDLAPLHWNDSAIEWNTAADKTLHDQKAGNWAKQHIRLGADCVVPVTSCFSGSTLYRGSRLLDPNIKYRVPLSKWECEHVPFTLSIPGTKVVDPNWAIWVHSF